MLAAKPSRLDHDRTAAVPLAALTCLQALVDHAALQPGQRVLDPGAAGGVDSFAVQMATALGGHVTATASARDLDFVTGLGAQQVIHYRAERFEDLVRDADVVLDRDSAAVGILISIAQPPNPEKATAHNVRALFFIVEPDRAVLWPSPN